jgi:hypothetical protein
MGATDEASRGEVMNEHRKAGTVETNPHVYEPLRQFGVSAKIWDEILEEVFGKPFGKLAGPFQNLLYEPETQRKQPSDFPRPYGFSDQVYIRGVLKQAIKEFKALDPSLRGLISDDGGNMMPSLG